MKVVHARPATARPWSWLGPTAAALAVGLGAWWFWPRAQVDPEQTWRQAESDFQAGRYDRAEAALERIGRQRALSPLDHVLRAQLGMVRGRQKEVLADLDAVPDDHVFAPQARLLAGQFELRLKHASSAERYLKEAVRLDPKLVQAHKELIYLYGMLLRRPELSAEFRRLSELVPLTYDNVFHWCLTRNSVWEPKELNPELRAYLAADEKDRWARLALAENLRQLGERAEASKLLEALPVSDPDAIVVRARLALDRNDDQALEEVLARGPEDHAELARLRGRLALARRDVPTALKAFRAAYRVEPDHRDALAGLGQALSLSGDQAAAAPFIAAAKEHDQFATLMQRASTKTGRHDPELWRALGASCEKIHRLPEARAWYDLVISANPLDAEAQKALHRINSAIASQSSTNAAPVPGS